MPNISQRQAFPFQKKKMEKIPVYNNRLYGDLFSQHTCTCTYIQEQIHKKSNRYSFEKIKIYI